MHLYSKDIYKRTLNGFFSILFLLVSLIWFSKTISFVKYITENGIELSQFLFLFVLILPWLMMYIIPISLFIAVLLVFNRMVNNNEIAILKNTGLTNIAIAKSTMKIAVFATIFCYLISFFLMPYANKKLRLSRINFENNYSNISFSQGVFENLRSLTIYVNEKKADNKLYGVFLHDEKNKEYSLTITSKSGNLSFEQGSLLLYMQDGTAQRYNRDSKESEILHFDEYVFNLSENNESKKIRTRWKPKERYLSELINPEEGVSQKEIDKYRAELQQRLTYPLISIVIVLFALSSMLSGNFSRRGNNKNIIFASFSAILFLSITIVIYRMIETKYYLTPILYFNFILFTLIAIKFLLPRRYK